MAHCLFKLSHISRVLRMLKPKGVCDLNTLDAHLHIFKHFKSLATFMENINVGLNLKKKTYSKNYSHE